MKASGSAKVVDKRDRGYTGITVFTEARAGFGLGRFWRPLRLRPGFAAQDRYAILSNEGSPSNARRLPLRREFLTRRSIGR